MKSLLLLLFAPILLSSSQPVWAQSTSTQQCADWQTCRDLAEQARAAGDDEAFHDLAWRAVQTRGRRDPDLFFLLARAQSRSGRPHDALITLQRLAQEMHVVRDVSADEDFRRVRALPGWPAVQEIIAQVAGGQVPDTSGGLVRHVDRESGRPEAREREPRAGSKARTPEPRTSTRRQNQLAEPAGRTNRKNPAVQPAWTEVARFPAHAFEAGGLAYDAVSRRFVIGNLPARKLTIVEEGTNRAATLSGDAAQLLNVRGLEIDRLQGDLWVVSEGARTGSDGATSELHKLQLVSGRVLTVYTADASNPPSRFVDVAVSRETGVLVLDASGPRLLRPARNGPHLREVMGLPAGEVTSLAPADDGRTVYVAYADHLARIDLSTQHVERVQGDAAAASGFTRVRFHKGSLVGSQVADGWQRIVQLRLGRNGGRIVSTTVLDGSDAPASPFAAMDVLENDFFYLVPGEPQTSIRRIRLK